MSGKLIALTGPIGCGKSTVARELERRGYVRVRFAGPLKAMLRTLGLSEAQVDGAFKNEPSALLCNRTPRHAMMTLGTEWGRGMIGTELWINATLREVDALRAAGRDVVIDDCRFDNEAIALTVRRLGSVYALARTGAGVPVTSRPLLARLALAGALPMRWFVHASESGVSSKYIRATIDNNGEVKTAADRIEAFDHA